MIALHIVAVVFGLVLAAAILAVTKGTKLHRVLGRLYAIALAITCIGSFAIREVRDGQLSIFHGASVIVLLSIVFGIAARRRGVVWLHALLMLSSVLLMVVTGTAQFFDDLPFTSDALNAIVFLQFPSMIGFTFIWRKAMRLRGEASS